MEGDEGKEEGSISISFIFPFRILSVSLSFGHLAFSMTRRVTRFVL